MCVSVRSVPNWADANDVAESVVVLFMVIFARIFVHEEPGLRAYECVCENRRVFVHDEVHVVDGVYVYD
jgi:hypothetical protein